MLSISIIAKVSHPYKYLLLTTHTAPTTFCLCSPLFLLDHLLGCVALLSKAVAAKMNRPAGLRLKRPRNSKLDTPRKKQKVTHVIQAFSVRDTAYRPPSVRSQQTSETPVRLPRTIQNKVFRTAKKNRRDPFHTLDDDVVYQIISLLPAKDTETLRRVSKLWRSSSEYHCGKVALLKQFPWAKPEIDMSATQEDLNLLYRRHCSYAPVQRTQQILIQW